MRPSQITRVFHQLVSVTSRREIRSYESEYVNALWHLDFHHGSLRVLSPAGQWTYPLLLGISDDRSRLCCHAQWYLAEGAEELCHGLSQALQKRSLARALMTDNGSAMLAAETTQGLMRLSILHETTLPYSPYYVASLDMSPRPPNRLSCGLSDLFHAT